MGSTVVRLKDVALVHDGFAPQENVVRVNGMRSTYLTVFKHVGASTLTVVSDVKRLIPHIESLLPPGIHLKPFFDQSVFVKQALVDVIMEGVIGTLLVSLMIYLFLGDLRSTVIILLSIPLSILTALFFLKISGESLNLMTLGGLALAIGMLVDDATVAIENIERNLALTEDPLLAVYDGANQVALPAFVGTLSILIVFFPVILLQGVSRFLFTPLALAVVFSMLASYFLSRTLVVTLSKIILQKNSGQKNLTDPSGPSASGKTEPKRSGISKLFLHFFEKLKVRYQFMLGKVLLKPGMVIATCLVLAAGGVLLLTRVGFDFFPNVDAGLLALHMRAPDGTRIEVSEQYAAQVEKALHNIIPPSELKSVDVNIGLPVFYNLAFYETDSIGPMDADFLISLKKHHHSVFSYQKEIRSKLAKEFPDLSFWFKPADIISQVLDFGLSAPIDIQVEGRNLESSYQLAKKIRKIVRQIPGAADVSIPQVMHYPTIFIHTHRGNALEVGLTQNDVASNLLVSLASSALVAPNYWVNPLNGINYIVAVQTPIPEIDSVSDLKSIPIRGTTPLSNPVLNTQYLSNLADVKEGVSPGSISHYTVQRVVDVLVNTQGRDLGSLTIAIKHQIQKLALPPGTTIRYRGQSEAMLESFTHFGLGLILALLLVYLLLVLNFQSFLDPFIILVSIPMGLLGVAIALFLTHTTLNVESAMGAIMVIGVATANSILLVTFANDERGRGLSAGDSAQSAGATRLRPILMTATAMILGMLPMAFGSGSGGEQNAPLGRAVIGGLLIATISTLFLVPAVYKLLRHEIPNRFRYDEEFNRSIKTSAKED